MTPRMQKVFTAMQWVLTAVFLTEGASKLLAVSFQVNGFTQWGYPLWFMYVIGGVEACGALLLFTRYRIYAVGALLVVMVGAIYTHVNSGQAPMSGLALVMIILLVMSTWIARKSNSHSF